MQSFLHNKYLRFALFGVGALLALIVIGVLLQLTRSGFGGHQSLFVDYGYDAVEEVRVAEYHDGAYKSGAVASERAMLAPAVGDSYYPGPIPEPDTGYNNLEAYETTDYNISARTRQFDEFCSSVRALKIQDQFDFRNISETSNHCSATFYTEEEHVGTVLATFEQFSGVDVNRNTNSVTRQRDRLESQTDILQQQLASVERTLAAAETDFDSVIAIARTEGNASELANAIRQKLQMVDSLTQRKINLTSQLSNLYRQAQDLEERIDAVQFYVSASPVIHSSPGEHERKWANAWHELTDAFTQTLIGLTTGLGIFLLAVIQYGVYILIVIVILRYLWKFLRKLWKA